MNQRRGIFIRGARIIRFHVTTHPLPFAMAVAGATVFAGATVASALVLGWVTDNVIVPSFDRRAAPRAVAGGIAAILLVEMVRAAGAVVRRYFAGMTAARAQVTLRDRLVDRYRRFPIAYYRSKPAGELLAHTDADVDAATEVLHPLPFSIAVVLLIVLAVVALVVTDVFLAVIGLVVMPILTLLSQRFAALSEPPATRAQQKVGDVSSVAHESLDGALVVKTLGRETAEVERLAAEVAELRAQRVELGTIRATYDPAFSAIPTLGMVALLAVGSWRASSGAVTTGTLVQFIALFQLLVFPMRVIGWLLFDTPKTVVGWERIRRVLEDDAGLPVAPAPTPLPDGPLDVCVRDISFSYDGTRVLDRVSFSVGANQTVAVVGPTGAGKSTLAEILVRLIDPDEGSVSLGGIDLRRTSPDDLRSAIAVVLQESFLFASSIRDNIVLGADVGHDDVVEAARLAQAHAFIERLPRGYETVVGERGVTLSGGERQRVALARALIRHPRVLVLDDAMSAVDPSIERRILDGLRDELETTVVVIAYRTSTIALADRVLFLKDGRLAGWGSHRALLDDPHYASIVSAYDRSRP